MAIQRWTGGASPIAQVSAATFAGTWLSTETITAAIGNKSITVVTGATAIATILATLQAALAALSSSVYPEFAEVEWSSTSTTLVGASATAGQPFTATITTNSASGTIDGSSGDAGVATIVSSGPNDWSTAANWSTGSVPITGDDVFFENTGDAIMYGLAQSAVTLASLNFATTFTGTIGLPEQNTDATAYPEYRPTFLAIGATAVNIGNGEQGGQGSGRIKLDAGSVQTTLTVTCTGTAIEQDVEPVQWRGTDAANVVNVFRGSMAIAGYATDAATVATLNVGYMTNQNSDANVRTGAGATLTAVNQSGSALAVSSAATTIVQTAGSLTLSGSAAYTTLSVAGALVYLCSGTVATLSVLGTGSVDFSQDMRARTVTNCTLYAGATLNDRFATVTWTNPILLSQCRIADVNLDVGQNQTLLPS